VDDVRHFDRSIHLSFLHGQQKLRGFPNRRRFPVP
jgi:hypothetical protein